MAKVTLAYNVNDSDLRNTFFEEIIPSAIDALDANTDPQWGKMSAQHMVEHLMFAFQMSTDKLEVDCETPEDKRANLQAFLNLNRPMPKGFVNPVTGTKLVELQHQSLKEAKEQLKKEINYFRDYYRAHPEANQTNPMFGELNAEQWEKFHFKHCFHHLSQFELINQEN